MKKSGNLTQQSYSIRITSSSSSSSSAGSQVGFIFLGGGPGGLSSSSSLMAELGTDLALRAGRFKTMAWPITLEVPGSGSSFLILAGGGCCTAGVPTGTGSAGSDSRTGAGVGTGSAIAR